MGNHTSKTESKMDDLNILDITETEEFNYIETIYVQNQEKKDNIYPYIDLYNIKNINKENILFLHKSNIERENFFSKVLTTILFKKGFIISEEGKTYNTSKKVHTNFNELIITSILFIANVFKNENKYIAIDNVRNSNPKFKKIINELFNKQTYNIFYALSHLNHLTPDFMDKFKYIILSKKDNKDNIKKLWYYYFILLQNNPHSSNIISFENLYSILQKCSDDEHLVLKRHKDTTEIQIFITKL